MISRPRTRRALVRLPHGNGMHRTSLQQKEALRCTKKNTRAFSAHPCGGIRTRTDAPSRAARGPSARASSAPLCTHLGEALELAELRDHAQRALLDAREAKAVVERGGGHRDRRGADGGASCPPLDARGRAAGRRRELLLGRRGGAGGRRVRGVARAAASGVRARIYLSHRAFDIKRRHILTPTRKFGRLGPFHGFIWNAFCKRSDIKRRHSVGRHSIRRFGCERNWQLRIGGRKKGRMAKGGSAGCRWDRSISCTRRHTRATRRTHTHTYEQALCCWQADADRPKHPTQPGNLPTDTLQGGRAAAMLACTNSPGQHLGLSPGWLGSQPAAASCIPTSCLACSGWRRCAKTQNARWRARPAGRHLGRG